MFIYPPFGKFPGHHHGSLDHRIAGPFVQMPRGRATPITTTWYSRDRRMGMPPPVISKDGFSSRAKGEQRTQTVIQLWLNVPYLSVGILARRSASPWPSLSRSVCSRISRHRCWELVHKAENARARSCAPPHRTSHSGPPRNQCLIGFLATWIPRRSVNRR
jgi:hypothetical protein